MTLKRRLITILTIALCVSGIYGVGRLGISMRQEEEEEIVDDSIFGHRETIYLWYTDEALTDYLNSVAVSYSEYQSDVRVIPVYTSGREYLETINQASLNTDEVPDMYIVSNDSLEKAYLAGLASEVRLPEGVLPMINFFPETAIRAVTYHDKQIGYPFYYETSCFLYNETYLEDWARAQIEAENDLAMAEEAQEQLENGGEPEENDSDVTNELAEENVISEEAVRERVAQTLPKTIDDILAFAYEYDAPDQVEVFKWDVSDIFYNYFFVGDSIDVGGVNGDRSDSIHIYNEDAIRCLKVYQNLNQFFSIDTKEISYDGILHDFMDGKIVYTVATTDALSKIEAAKAEGEFSYEFGISMMPDVSDELSSASLSVTQCVVINGYSMKKNMANDFAVYLTEYDTDALYTRTGKLPVYDSGDTYSDPNKEAFFLEYTCSIPMPKMIETSNFWVELEIAFAKIWDGEDANNDLKALSEKIMGQVIGGAYEEEYIDMPEEVPEEEYEDGELTEEDGESQE